MNFGALDDRLGSNRRQVVTIEIDIETAYWDWDSFELLNSLGEPFGQGNAASTNADESQILRAAISLHDLMGQPSQRAFHFGRCHDLSFFLNAHGGSGRSTTIAARY